MEREQIIQEDLMEKKDLMEKEEQSSLEGNTREKIDQENLSILVREARFSNAEHDHASQENKKHDEDSLQK